MTATSHDVMICLVYASSARELFSKQALVDLLEISRRNNTRDGITGLLLYKDGNFLQAIEGGEAAIRGLHAKISGDPRHDGLITLLDRPIEQRQFSGWSMGFRDLTDPALRDVPGYSEFLNASLSGAEFAGQPTRVDRLLQTFRQRM